MAWTIHAAIYIWKRQAFPYSSHKKRTNRWSVWRKEAVASRYWRQAFPISKGWTLESSVDLNVGRAVWLSWNTDATLGFKTNIGIIKVKNVSLQPRELISETLLADVIATKKATFRESHLIEDRSSCSNSLPEKKKSRTRGRSQLENLVFFWGLSFIAHLNNYWVRLTMRSKPDCRKPRISCIFGLLQEPAVEVV